MSILVTYLGPVHSAILIFPFLALALTVPYLIYEYARYGSIPLLRTLIVYSFLLYLINVYFQVILPLPDPDSVTDLGAAAIQTDPLNLIRELRDLPFSLSDPHTWKETLRDPVCYQAILNVALFFPLGIYLHYYFRCGLIRTFLLCFLGSLFCELTQLSGLYGIYPHAYRIFDVDDLILNTLGGLTGWIFSPLFCLLLPSREELDSKAYRRGENPPLFRRFLAFLIDFGVISLLQAGIALRIPDTSSGKGAELLTSILLTLVYYLIFTFVTGGYTIGSLILRFQITDVRGKRPSFGQLLARYGFLTLLVIHAPQYYILCKSLADTPFRPYASLWRRGQSAAGVLCALFTLEVLVRFISGRRIFFFERLAGTRIRSTIGKK